MSVTRKIWSRTADGKAIYRYTLTNSQGASVVLTNIGAGIVAINVPDRDGKMGDVVLGYGKAESYFGDGPCLGKCPGRFAGRIGNGSFTLDGKKYTLPQNNAKNCLHGGPEGFSNQVWESRKKKGGVEFKYFSKDGESGFPGNVVATVRYDWSEDNELRLSFTAKTDAKTVINLTNHAYFNLDGASNVMRHVLRMNASKYVPTDSTLCPEGPLMRVQGTPLDFRKAKTIGRDFKKDCIALKYGKGYDGCWVLDNYVPGQLQEAGELYSPKSGRCLTIYTTQPGLQMYTGNYLDGCPKGKRGTIYHDHKGVALECQHFPDSPNRPDFPSTVLRPGKLFHEAIIFAFSAR